MKIWKQSDLSFCQNEGSKRSENNENGDQQDRKQNPTGLEIAKKGSIPGKLPLIFKYTRASYL